MESYISIQEKSQKARERLSEDMWHASWSLRLQPGDLIVTDVHPIGLRAKLDASRYDLICHTLSPSSTVLVLGIAVREDVYQFALVMCMTSFKTGWLYVTKSLRLLNRDAP